MLTEASGALFFLAQEPNSVLRLWKSDGTETGTVPVKAVSRQFDYPTGLDGFLFFVDELGLWRTNGTAQGTFLVKAGATRIPPASANGTLFFAAGSENGVELWRTDVIGQTRMVKDIAVGPQSSSPAELTNVDGVLFFTANDGQTGREVWKSDGTTAGTVLLKDTLASRGELGPFGLANVNGVLFFLTPNGISHYDLWSSNGTDEGTVRLQTIAAVKPSMGHLFFFAFAGSTFFYTPDDDMVGRELWGLSLPGLTPLPTYTPTPRPTPTMKPPCVGDCDGDGFVTIDELVRGVNIALGTVPLSQCAIFDQDSSGDVTVNELIAAVNNALSGCP